MTDLAIHQPSALAEQMEFARVITEGDPRNSLLPQAYRGNPGNVLIAVGLGAAMGLSPAESLYRIDVIQGTPAAGAELIAQNVRRAGHKLRVQVSENPPAATATIVRADDPDYRTGDYSPTTAYARSKRWQVEMAPLLGERWTPDGITVATMHPGWADTPGVQESLPRFRSITRPVLRDDAQGADTSVWLSAVEPAPPTGRFWHDRVERPTSLLPSTRPSDDVRATAWAWLRDVARLP